MTDTKVSALADNGDIDPATGGDFYFAPSGAAVGKRVTAAEMYRFTALEARLDKTANYTAAAADAGKTIRGDATGGAITLKLPAAGTTDGDTITFRKADSSANRVTVQDNAGAGDIAWLSAQRDEVTFAWWNGSWIADTYYIQPLRQVFQASGTWIRPPLLTAMDVIAFGAGGGGGSGRRNTATIRVGGGGGGGGNSIYQNLPAGVLGSSETVTIGAGGAGGLSRTADTQNGLIGSNGGDTTFGAYLKAAGGLAGAGGAGAAASGGGYASAAGVYFAQPSTFGSPAIGGTSSISAAPGAVMTAMTGGGGPGGGLTAAPVVILPGAGGNGSGSAATETAGGAAGTTGSVNGIAGADVSSLIYQTGGGGGGGGYANTTGAGGTGGAGGAPGGGGGGGGGAENGNASGAGGAGGRGEVRLIMYFS